MKNLLNVLATAYVAFAILTAYQAVGSFEKPAKRDTAKRGVLDSPEPSLQNPERLRGLDTADYRVEEWGAEWCYACRKWKREELPKLRARGVATLSHDIDKEKPPTSFKTIPHIIIYYKDKIVFEGGYMSAAQIFVYIRRRP